MLAGAVCGIQSRAMKNKSTFYDQTSVSFLSFIFGPLEIRARSRSCSDHDGWLTTRGNDQKTIPDYVLEICVIVLLLPVQMLNPF